MADIIKPDLCIVGAGAVGRALAIAARQRGLTTVLVDRGISETGDPLADSLGRAALAASAAQAQAFRTAARLGLDNGPPKISFKTIAEHIAAVILATAPASSAQRLAALGVDQVVGAPAFLDRLTLGVGEGRFKPRHIILATGAAPAVPDVPGFAEIAYFTPETILANTRKLSHLLVIGGGATALEMAQAYRRLGSDVTLVPHGPLLDGYDPETAAILLRHLRDEGLAILEGTAVTAIVPRSQGIGIVLSDAQGHASSLDVSHVLLAQGRVPDLAWLAGDKLRLKRDNERPAHLQLDPQGRTSHIRISAFGGAAGEDNFHLALRQGERLLDHLAGRAGRDAAAGLPMSVATEPSLSQLGLVDTAGRLKPGQSVLRANLSENDAARAIGLAQGSAKLVVDKQGRILGAAMVGTGAGETMASLALLIDRGVTAAQLACLPVVGTSVLAILADLGRQYAASAAVSQWRKGGGAVRRLLP